MVAKAATVLALAVSTFVGVASAQNSDGGPAPAPEVSSAPRGPQVAIPADFGLGTNILQIPAAAFTARGAGAVTTYLNLGYLGWNTAGDMWAPVFLPSGAAIDYLDVYYCDNNAGSSITFFLTRYEGYNDGNRVTNDIAFITSTDGTGTGCNYDFKLISPAHTVNNNVRYNGGGQYVINTQPSGTAGISFKAVDLWWRRQISPAPATASFVDVPVGAQFFQQIEALKASGITAGCASPAGGFCPNDPVTRGQMAAFLARALGLYWPF